MAIGKSGKRPDVNEPTVSVALCTFNGTKYARAQLDSIAAQSRPPDEIVVCDDRSDDDTVAIVRDFAKDAGFPVRIEINERRLGTILNFDKAIGLCRGDIVFLSDQDDLWRPGKIEHQTAQLREMEGRYGRDTPILVHSDLEVAGPNLDRIAPSFLRRQGLSHLEGDSQRGLLVQNFVTGCATAVNRALIDLARPIPEDCMMHDWWLALCAAARGHIGFSAAPLVSYRQHRGNQLGSRGVLRQYNPIRNNYRQHWKQTQALLRRTMRQAALLRDRLAAQEPSDNAILAAAAAYANLDKYPRLQRLRMLRRHDLRRQDPFLNVWMNVKVALL